MQTETTVTVLDLTQHWVGYTSLALFVVAYAFVMAEEFTHLRKSKPVLLVAGIIWAMAAWVYVSHGQPDTAGIAIRHTLEEYAEIMLFLLVAMTYINALEERHVFEALRTRLVRGGWSLRSLFWITGGLAFVISPVADNLTTALLMCAVAMAVGAGDKRFILLACINIVVAANAGGAFSPFGDITTLMVWQKEVVEFWTFFALFVPSLVNWLVPALFMYTRVPNECPVPTTDNVVMRRGARRIMLAFIATIATAVVFHQVLHLPPAIGMMTGLGYLKILGFYLKKTGERTHRQNGAGGIEDAGPWDIFKKVSRAEWDTLFFFYGVIMCVGGLGFMGYLEILSQTAYGTWGPWVANVGVGIVSAVVDNIPVMFAVLTMNPEMSQGHWLLVTLTAGVGGSMLSIGSAAGVALMGQARGMYTFFGHLKWAPFIMLGYVASIMTHMWINAHMF